MTLKEIEGNPICISRRLKSGETVYEHRFVKSVSGEVAAISAPTDLAIGVLLSTSTETYVELPIQVGGPPVDVEVGAAGVTEGHNVKIDSVGRVVDSAFASGDVVVGQTLDTKTSGQFAKIRLMATIDVP